MELISPAAGAGNASDTPDGQHDAAAAAVTALYREHALGLTRLANLMLGSRPAAEDVVQDAFCALYRRWQHLSDTGKALPYLRACVLNGCRTALRARGRDRGGVHQPPVVSAESVVLTMQDRSEVLAALRRLPDRQREALVLRFYLDLSDAEIARDMGISRGTVRSTTHRGLAALGITLKETP
jgi:RNA polymerase sigma-70 factor (sigma-E family)